jgi:hypothetical protein
MVILWPQCVTVHCVQCASFGVRPNILSGLIPKRTEAKFLFWMRSSLLVRASDCQCTCCNGSGIDPSIRRHSGIWGAADEAVLNILWKKKILSLWPGALVDSGIGLPYRPNSLAGRYDKPMPESTISPSQGLRIWLYATVCFLAFWALNIDRGELHNPTSY